MLLIRWKLSSVPGLQINLAYIRQKLRPIPAGAGTAFGLKYDRLALLNYLLGNERFKSFSLQNWRYPLFPLLTEGLGVRGTARACDVDPHNVLNVLQTVGEGCERLHDRIAHSVKTDSL